MRRCARPTSPTPRRRSPATSTTGSASSTSWSGSAPSPARCSRPSSTRPRSSWPTRAGKTVLRATGSVIAFDGFLKLYREDEDDRAADARAGIAAPTTPTDDDTRTLPPMRESDPLKRGEVTASQHFTQPPPRFSEASLVKKMEELGIGRPSTYASILQALQDRDYVTLDKRRFIPEDRGRLVTAFLVSFFERYVDTGFTAGLEDQLDDISGGKIDWRAVMRAFWEDFRKAVDATKDLKISDVIDALDEELGPHFFPAAADGTDPRVCPACSGGRLGLRLGRTGAFIGCSNYPECRYTRPLAVPGADGEDTTSLAEGQRELGSDPASGEAVTLRRGPYGLYVQLGEAGVDAKGKPTKPRRASLTRGHGPGDARPRPGAGAAVAAARRSAATRRPARRSPPASAASAPTSGSAPSTSRWSPATTCCRSA